MWKIIHFIYVWIIYLKLLCSLLWGLSGIICVHTTGYFGAQMLLNCFFTAGFFFEFYFLPFGIFYCILPHPLVSPNNFVALGYFIAYVLSYFFLFYFFYFGILIKLTPSHGGILNSCLINCRNSNKYLLKLTG